MSRATRFYGLSDPQRIPGTYGGNQDGFIIKFNIVGNQLFSTYLGGTACDSITGIAVDPIDNVYITGSIGTAGVGCAAAGATPRSFVSKFTPNLGAQTYSTILGTPGSTGGRSSGNGITVDSTGNAYITGTVMSQTIPLVNPFLSTLRQCCW